MLGLPFARGGAPGAVGSTAWNGCRARRRQQSMAWTPQRGMLPRAAARWRYSTPRTPYHEMLPGSSENRRYSTPWTPRRGIAPRMRITRHYSTPWTPCHGMLPGSSENRHYSTPWTPQRGMLPGSSETVTIRRRGLHAVECCQPRRLARPFIPAAVVRGPGRTDGLASDGRCLPDSRPIPRCGVRARRNPQINKRGNLRLCDNIGGLNRS